jgi:hypothetical protein
MVAGAAETARMADREPVAEQGSSSDLPRSMLFAGAE